MSSEPTARSDRRRSTRLNRGLRKLQLIRWLFLAFGPLSAVVGLLGVAYRYDIALIAFVVYLPVVVPLGLARCPRCQGFFFNEWLLLAWGPWRVFARRPSCSRCGLALHECQGAVDA